MCSSDLAGDAGMAAVLAKARLSEADFTRLNNDWVERMRNDPGLSIEYGALYMEQAVGPLAAYGRAVGAAQRGKAKLSGAPPLPEADWLHLHKAQLALYGDGKDPKAAAQRFDELARAKGLRAYDFHLANMWWFTLASQQAQAGDMALMNKLAAR